RAMKSELLPIGDYPALIVEDNGHGIKPALLGKIFEPFFTTKDDSHGTGLGLATVYGIVQRHGGHLQVESAPGAGTCIRTLLPLSG
ncbi:ATP-binding protein, partial [Acinetobacter baumannii]